MISPGRKLTAADQLAAAPRMTEAQLQQSITDLCRYLALYVYHTRDSRGSARGFPDLVIVGPCGILWRELKSDTGTITPDQRAWGRAIDGAAGNWSVWRPSEWHSGRIRRELFALTGREVTP
jgi:hypothetical protein